TVPVRLNTVRRRGRASCSSRAPTPAARADTDSAARGSVPASASRRSVSSCARSVAATRDGPYCPSSTSSAGSFNTRSSEGMSLAAAMPPPATAPGSVTVVLPQQRVAAAPRVVLVAHQHVQRQAPEVVGHRLHERILVLVEDLAVAPAAVAGLGLDPLAAAIDVVERD